MIFSNKCLTDALRHSNIIVSFLRITTAEKFSTLKEYSCVQFERPLFIQTFGSYKIWIHVIIFEKIEMNATHESSPTEFVEKHKTLTKI